VQTEVELMDRAETIICEECGQSIIVEYVDDEMRTIQCPCCGVPINILWSW
jgi:DNA-directed RNA polymerase subunit RPC12/RpoP